MADNRWEDERSFNKMISFFNEGGDSEIEERP